MRSSRSSTRPPQQAPTASPGSRGCSRACITSSPRIVPIRAGKTAHWMRQGDDAAVGENLGFAVASERNSQATLGLHLQPCQLRLRFLRPRTARGPQSKHHLRLRARRGVAGDVPRAGWRRAGTYTFEGPGLWTIEGRFLARRATRRSTRSPSTRPMRSCRSRPAWTSARPDHAPRGRARRAETGGAIRARPVGPDGEAVRVCRADGPHERARSGRRG